MTAGDLAPDVARTVLEHAPDGLVLVDADGRIVLVNAQAEKLFDYQRAELLLQPVEILLPEGVRDSHEHDRANYTAAPMVRPMGVAQNLRGRRRDGSTFPIEVSLSPIQAEERLLVLAAVRDVSARREAEEQLAEARRRALLLEDRERVGRDLHDTVIQELFATGMHLQAAVPGIHNTETAERVVEAIDAIDATIKQIRETIFGLTGLAPSGHNARDKIAAVVSSFTEVLGFDPGLEFDGDIASLSGSVTEHLVPTVREALANTVRHARASEVAVAVRTDDETISLEVLDDGIGILGPTQRLGGHGLRNMQERAVALGGSFAVEARQDGGTRLVWSVPRRAPRSM